MFQWIGIVAGRVGENSLAKVNVFVYQNTHSLFVCFNWQVSHAILHRRLLITELNAGDWLTDIMIHKFVFLFRRSYLLW